MFRDRPMQASASEHSSDPPLGSCCADERLSVPDTVPARLELPPILGPILSASVPDFPTIPPPSTIKPTTRSGCTCSFSCTCPGCVEHRTLRHVEKHHKDCSEGCGHCVDRTSGIELPDQDTSGHDGTLVDNFFTRAAALPNPPSNRRTELDPGDITVYPYDLFSGSSTEADERGVAFGLVKVPKLECCRGQCGCPAGGCQCGQSCGGGCDGTPS